MCTGVWRDVSKVPTFAAAFQVSSLFRIFFHGRRHALSSPVARFALAVLWLFSACGVHAATLERLSIEDMVEKSTAIVRGRVTHSFAAAQGSLIYTHFTVQVLDRFKGPERPTMEVLVPGGVANGVRQSFPGVPRLAPGKEYMLFLWTGRKGVTQVIGFTQGVFELRAAQGDQMAVRSASSEPVIDRATGTLAADQRVEMRLRDLADRIRTHLTKGPAR